MVSSLHRHHAKLSFQPQWSMCVWSLILSSRYPISFLVCALDPSYYWDLLTQSHSPSSLIPSDHLFSQSSLLSHNTLLSLMYFESRTESFINVGVLSRYLLLSLALPSHKRFPDFSQTTKTSDCSFSQTILHLYRSQSITNNITNSTFFSNEFHPQLFLLSRKVTLVSFHFLFCFCFTFQAGLLLVVWCMAFCWFYGFRV